VCPSKHVEPSVNFGIINSITKLHLVGISTEYISKVQPTRCNVFSICLFL